MSIGREEFLRLLPAAVGPFDLTPVADTVPVAHTLPAERALSVAQASWLAHPRGTIRLVPLPHRRIGRVVIPRHRVEIALEDCTEVESAAFMDRFHRAFLRGGG